MSRNGTKNNQGKPRMSLLPPEGVLQEAKAMSLGEDEYGTHNYREKLYVLELLDAALRHIWKCINGGDIDPDSIKNSKGKWEVHHLGAAKAELGMALQMIKDHPEMDDRYKVPYKSPITVDRYSHITCKSLKENPVPPETYEEEICRDCGERCECEDDE